NRGERNEGSELTMVDTATRHHVPVAQGGTRGDVVLTTSDGRLLVSQSSQVDVLNPIRAPNVVATNPAHETIVALPLSLVTVTYDQEMFTGEGTEIGSVINPLNYSLISLAGDPATIRRVDYDPASRTALLHVEGLEA